MPAMTQQALGFAMFIGSVFTFTHLASSGEMTAIRAAGVSLRQVLMMILPVALVFCALDLVVADQVAPRSQAALSQWLVATAPKTAQPSDKPLWFHKGNDIVRVERATQNGALLQGVRIYRRGPEGDLVERVTARAARPADQGWTLSGAVSTRIGFDDAEAGPAGETHWSTSLKPTEVAALQRGGFLVSSGASIRSLAGGAANQSPSVFVTRLNRLFAEPLGLVVMLLLAAPLALNHARAGNLGLLLYGIGGGLLYLVADGLMTVWGQVGVLPPTLGAWGTPIAFAAAAFTVLLYAEA
jgi:lipopolysaccharide export system permease protein